MNGQTNVMLTLNTALYETFDIDAAETTADSSPKIFSQIVYMVTRIPTHFTTSNIISRLDM